MILYQKGWGGLFVVFRIVGTAWPHGVIPGLLAVGVGRLAAHFDNIDELISDEASFLKHHYPYQLFAYMVGFFIVFRTNFAYRRYWLSLDAVQRMSSKWLDGACMCVTFDAPGSIESKYLENAVGGKGGQTATDSADVASGPAGISHSEFFTQVVHLFSLLHALALQHLRADKNLDNLQDTRKMQLRLTAVGPTKHYHASGWAWLDSLLGFSEEKVEEARRRMKLSVLGDLSPEWHKMLATDTRGRPVPTEARVSMAFSWCMRRCVARQKHEPMGDMAKTSPPIIARYYQVMSDGMLAFSQASMVTAVPFPFPYHNLTQMFLWVYALTVPLVINAKIEHIAVRMLLTFLSVWAYFALSAVGDNLEDPYLPYDPNDLPLTVMQHNFNAQLVSFGVAPQKTEKVEEVEHRNSQGSIATAITLVPETGDSSVKPGGGAKEAAPAK
eukprot:TRINITY_DN17536_c0_g1_i1.p1 TRINITY_DN17536_c0_g1~~TRINITY_DN17536_c0_g1_i1.p1  ORF type:complete len:442 (-),score=86.94 TRINITY_DN17536_c0_g1_i1:219-1544(-)